MMMMMMMKKLRSDDGLSLIELIVVVVLLGVLGTVIAVIFANTWKAQDGVATQTAATARGQLVTSEVERAMRNAVAFQISSDGSTLQVQTSYTDSRQCQGFYLTSSGANMTLSVSPANGAPGSWPSWQSGLTQQGVTPFFTPVGTTGVSYAFNIKTSSAPVSFTGEAFMRNSTSGTLSPCW